MKSRKKSFILLNFQGAYALMHVRSLSYKINERKVQGLGRNALYSQLKEKGVVVSDVRLRKLLDELKDEQMVEIHQGRKGTNITKKGFLYLQEHIDLLA